MIPIPRFLSIGWLAAAALHTAPDAVASQGCQTITALVSRSSSGAVGDETSYAAAPSEDGRYVAFQSRATNFAPVQPGVFNVFRRDRATGTTAIVSATAAGNSGLNDSTFASISNDGRFVAFTSASPNLAPADTNGVSDCFVKDMHTGALERVSVSSFETQANGSSLWPEISGDGRYVVFQSAATNLLAIPETNGFTDVYIRDRLGGTTSLVSIGVGGFLANGASTHASVSADGRFVAFESRASNLVSGDTNQLVDVFLRDRASGTTQRASVGGTVGVTPMVQGNGDSKGASVSDDGRWVAFLTDATNLGGIDGNSTVDVYARDLVDGVTRIVSQSTSSLASTANGVSNQAEISGDGRFVAFRSSASNLVNVDDGLGYAIFVRDLSAATTQLVSVTSGGQPAQESCGNPRISRTGAWVTFDCGWSGFSSIDTNGEWDAFLRGVDCGFPQAYGAPKLTSNGCLPEIAWTGEPQASLGGQFMLHCTNAINQKSGLMFYGFAGRASIPFQGGTLHVMPPTRRSPLLFSNGSPPPANDCSGRFVLDMDAFAAGASGGNPAPELRVIGTPVNAQWWGRDPGHAAPNDSLLSNAVEYTVRP
jgi:Tol biopolymer transport system component